MEAGSPSAAPLSAPLGSSQSGPVPVVRSSKLRRTSTDGSDSTDMGSVVTKVVTVFLDTFDGISDTTY
jgi:hypothetical protein